jgi:hypothetical protein
VGQVGTGPLSRNGSASALEGQGDGFELPPLELLEPALPFPIQEHEAKINARAMLLERTLQDFG